MGERKEFLTAHDVMEHLHVGRTFVYEQARLYLATGGAEGLPVRRFGRLLRFPLDELDAWTAKPAPVVDLDTRRTDDHTPSAPVRKAARQTVDTRSPRSSHTGQSALPFTS